MNGAGFLLNCSKATVGVNPAYRQAGPTPTTHINISNFKISVYESTPILSLCAKVDVGVKCMYMNITKLKQNLIWVVPILLLSVMAILLIQAAKDDAAIVDESPHITAGYSYLKFFDARLNPEHPPLIKDLAGLPLQFLNLNFPTQTDAWQKNVNDQWALGHDFLWGSGNNGHQIVFWARIGPILITLLLGFFVFFWTRKIAGNWAASLALALYAFSPTILAHGHLVTTDVGAAAGIIIATYFFIKYLKENSWQNLLLAGIIFGLAQLTKFSVFLLVPFFFFLTLWWYMAHQKSWVSFFKIIGGVILIGILGAVVINLWYMPHVWNYPQEKQLSDAQSILQSFSSKPLADLDFWLIKNPILRPLGQFFLGILMVTQRAVGGNTAYFLGDVTNAGWWYYFPVVYVLKEPLAFLIMVLTALCYSLYLIWERRPQNFSQAVAKTLNWSRENFEIFALLCFVIFYMAYSMKSNLNIGARHLMPLIPMMYILVSVKLSDWMRTTLEYIPQNILTAMWLRIKHAFSYAGKFSIVLVLLAWYIVSSLLSAPMFLSYFNEIAGGPTNGYKYVVDSNYDWGQDLYRLRDFVDRNFIDKIGVDYFGGGNPRFELGPKVEAWNSSLPKYDGKWFAISTTFLQNVSGELTKGFKRQVPDEYSWLLQEKPFARAGQSIFIYKLK